MRNPLTLIVPVVVLACASGSARAQPGYAMPSEYPGFGVYAPGTSRALSYGVTPTSIPGWYGYNTRSSAYPYSSNYYRTPDLSRGTTSGPAAVSGWRTYGGRGWRR